MMIHIAKEFTDAPAGRFLTDGPYSGEAFRENFLRPALEQNEFVEIDLDGVEGYGSSFLEEAFGGLVRKGYFTKNELESKLKLKSADKAIILEIKTYIDEARSEIKNK